jgi:hypothetical protein
MAWSRRMVAGVGGQELEDAGKSIDNVTRFKFKSAGYFFLVAYTASYASPAPYSALAANLRPLGCRLGVPWATPFTGALDCLQWSARTEGELQESPSATRLSSVHKKVQPQGLTSECAGFWATVHYI